MAFVETKKSCPNCGGSDPVGINEDGSAWCFSCETRIHDYYGNKESNRVVDITPRQTSEFKKVSPNTSAEFNELTDRGISLETAKHFGVKSIIENGEVVKHFYPYYILNEVAGYKVRDASKNFTWNGDAKGTGLFGEQVASSTSANKYITITEGECDCMAAYELQGSRFPVVSVKNGAGGAVRDVKHSLEFLESFERVYISFDSDKPGREAARRVAQLLSPGKAKIVKLPEGYKDANDMLRNNARAAYMKAWWDAKTYTPSGVLNASDLIDKYMVREKKESVPYPWTGLNEKLYGMRQGELITLTGGTGLGKSSITRELEHWLVKTTNDNVGIIALEESYLKTLDCLLSIELNQRLYIDSIREQFPEEDITNAYKNLFLKNGDNRVWVFSHLGVNELEDIYSKIRFMIVGCDCKWIIVDHLHMLVSSSTEGDERRTIDSIMHRLRSIVEETGAGMILVSHLRRVDGSRAHENGVEVNLSHLRGSQSIAQLSDCVLALERNQQAENEQEANTTTIRVLKSRYTGDVGMATNLLYNKETGRLSEIFLDEDDFEDSGDFL